MDATPSLPRRGRGRPSLGDDARNVNLAVRLTAADLALLQAAAGDTPVSTWMREVCLAYANVAGSGR